MAKIKNKEYPYYELPEIKDLKDMIQQKALALAKLPAFVYPGKNGNITKTYSELRDDINAFGTWLYSKKFKNSHIAIIGENSYEWLVAFFAIVNGGNVAVAIDKGLPENEIKNLCKIGDVDAAFVSETYIDKVKKKAVRKCKSFDDFEEILAEGRNLLADGYTEYLNYVIEPEKTATILFTSGTSGQSKGVELTNANIAYELVNTCKLFRPEGNVVAVLPFHHSFGLVVGIFMVLNYGQAIYINKSLKLVKKNMQEFGPQTMFLVPMFVEFFHRQIWNEIEKKGKTAAFKGLMKSTDLLLKTGVDVRRKTYGQILNAFGGNLEYIICGGAPLNPMYVKEFRSWGIEILNGYGSTECSPVTAVNRPLHHKAIEYYPPDTMSDQVYAFDIYHKDGSVGLVVPGSEVKTTEDGEICFRAGYVMKGYYKNPEATAEAIEDGWFHTGDLGYVDDDGFVFLTGRKKNLIILSNGENISPEELELDFSRDPGVQEVLVYDYKGKIVAEIFPVEDRFGDATYFEKLKDKINKGRPIYKQITRVKLRREEFIKNGSMKIVRHLNVPAEIPEIDGNSED